MRCEIRPSVPVRSRRKRRLVRPEPDSRRPETKTCSGSRLATAARREYGLLEAAGVVRAEETDGGKAMLHLVKRDVAEDSLELLEMALDDDPASSVTSAKALWIPGTVTTLERDRNQLAAPEGAQRELILLVFRFAPELDLHLAIGESKSGQGKKGPKAADRLLWIHGVQDLVGADSAFVATTRRASDRLRGLAAKLGVSLLDERDLPHRERIQGLDEKSYWGPHDPDLLARQREIYDAIKDDDELKRVYWFLRSEFWLVSPTVALKRGFGAEELSREADRYMLAVLKEAGVEPGKQVGALGALSPEPPSYSELLIEVIERVAEEPAAAAALPRVTDWRLAGTELGVDLGAVPGFEGSIDDVERLQRLVSAFLEGQIKVPRAMFDGVLVSENSAGDRAERTAAHGDRRAVA